MEEQYNKLSKQIRMFYCRNIVVAFIIMAAFIIFKTDIVGVTSQNFTNYSDNSQQEKLKLILDQSQATIQSILLTVQQIFNGNYSLPNSSVYCNSSLTYQQCHNSQSQYTQLIRNTFSTSNSFRCLSGSCLRISALWDYLWVFKIRYSFIGYFIIEYQVYNDASQLIVPVLANQTIEINTQEQFLDFTQGQLIMTKNSQTNSSLVKISVVFDTEVLQSSYNINLTNFIFKSNISASDQIKSISSSQSYNLNLLPYKVGILLQLLLSFIMLVLVIAILISRWQKQNFQNLQTLNSLYRYQLNQIFLGKKPKNTVIMNQHQISFFYEELSEIMDRDYEQISMQPLAKQKEESFKFIALIQRIMSKYQVYHRPIHLQRTRQINNFKYLIKSSVTEISDNVNKKLKEYFMRAKDINLTQAFFLYGYLSMLLNIQQYDRFLEEDDFPIPQLISGLFRYMNRTINSNEICYAFKLSSMLDSKTIEQVLIMKIHFSLLQKYFMSLKELDFGLNYAKELNLQKDLKYLQEVIENQKYIFTTYLK